MNALWLVLLPAVAAVNPASLCYPARLSFTVYDSRDGGVSSWSLDYDKSMLSGGNEEFHLVRDFQSRTDWVSGRGDAGPWCFMRDTDPERFIYRCLPAGSSLLTESTVGQGQNALRVQTWEVPGPRGVVYDAFQMVDGHIVPVFYRNPRWPGHLISYFNVTTGIPSSVNMQPPSDCSDDAPLSSAEALPPALWRVLVTAVMTTVMTTVCVLL